jgi:hypothetical protein
MLANLIKVVQTLPRRSKATGPAFRYFEQDPPQFRATLRTFLNDASGNGLTDVQTCLPVRSYFVDFSNLSPAEQQMVGRRCVQFVTHWNYYNGSKSQSTYLKTFMAPVDWQAVTVMLAHPPQELKRIRK